jgi:hypothetical protein
MIAFQERLEGLRLLAMQYLVSDLIYQDLTG